MNWKISYYQVTVATISGQLINETDDHGGYYILRAMRLSRIAVHRVTREDGQVVSKRTKPLSDLVKSLPKRQLIAH